MNLLRLAGACFVLALAGAACCLAFPEKWEACAYLLALSTLTVIPIAFLRSRSMSVGALLLLTPTLLLSVDSFMLRLGWLNLFAYQEHSWDAALGEEALRKAAGLALMGNAALWAGHFAPWGQRWGAKWARRARRAIQNQEVRPDIVRIWVAFAIGIAARLFIVRSGIGGYFSETETREEALPYIQFIVFIESLSALALVLYFSVLIQQRNPFWTPFGVMLAVELATVVLLGFKGLIVTRFLLLAIMYALVKRRLAWQIFAAGTGALILIFPINLAVRASFNSGEFNAGDIGAIQRSLETSADKSFNGATFEENALQNLEQVGRNSAQIEPFAMIVQYVDRTGQRFWGAEYGHFVYGYIPRVLWPDKPSPMRGGWVYQEVYGRKGNTGLAQTVPGNFYLNFGAWGVVGGLFLYGALSRGVGDFLLGITSMRYLPLIPFLVLSVGMPVSDLGAHITGLSQAILFKIAVLCFLVPATQTRKSNPAFTVHGQYQQEPLLPSSITVSTSRR